jgi:L-fuconolactonase
MIDFPIVDSHFHIWNKDKLRYPWLDNRGVLNQNYLIEDYNRACGGYQIEKMVYVEVTSTDYRKEVQWVCSVAKEDPRLQAVVSWAPLDKGDAATAQLDELARNPLVRGIRRMIQKEPDIEFCLRPDFIKGVNLLSRYGLIYDMGVLPFQLENVIKFVRQCPNIPFVIEHIAQPDIKGGMFEPWAELIKEISRMPNVHCKMSGLITKADWERWKKEDLKPYVDHVMACFGLDRIMYGSDWPPINQVTTIPIWIETLDWALGEISVDQRRKIFHDNAVKFYGLS